MDDKLKEILKKPAEEITDEEKELVKAAAGEFQTKVSDLCAELGFAYKAVLKVTPEGILPGWDIVPITPKE